MLPAARYSYQTRVPSGLERRSELPPLFHASGVQSFAARYHSTAPHDRIERFVKLREEAALGQDGETEEAEMTGNRQ